MVTLLESAKFINEAIGDFHQLSNTEKTVGKLKKGNTHWAVRVVQTTFLIGAISGVVAYIIGQTVIVPCAVVITLLSAFSWYWIRDLSLLKSLDDYLQQVVPIIKKMNEYIKSQQEYLKKELQITDRIVDENQKFSIQVDRMEKNDLQFQKDENEINKEILQQNQEVKKQLEKLEEIEKKAEITEQQLEKEKKITENLQNQNNELQTTVQKMNQENERLEKNRNILLKDNQQMREIIKTLSIIETNIHKELQTMPGEINKFQKVINQIETGTVKMEKSDKKENKKITDTANEFLEEQQTNIDTLSELNKNLTQFKENIKKTDIKKN